MNNVALVIIILGLIGVFIFRKNKPKRNIFIVVSIAAFLVFGLTMDKDDKKEATVSSSSTETKFESTSKKDTKTTESTVATYSEVEQTAKDSLNDFSAFVTNYDKIPSKEKPDFFGKIYGTQVTWTGIAIGTSKYKVHLIEASKYKIAMTWDEVLTTEDEYYVFSAKFDQPIDERFVNGGTYTFTGSLVSRGIPNPPSGWRIENSEFIQ